MKKFLLVLMVAISAASMVVSEAEAKRLGGGGSFGRQSQGLSRQTPAQPAQNQMTNPASQQRPSAAPGAAQTPKPASPWRNILGGALLGLGLGALLSHLGIGGAFASMISSILMIALLAFAAMFIYRMFRRKETDTHARQAYAGGYSTHDSATGPTTPEIGSRIEPQARPLAFQSDTLASGSAVASNAMDLPADFDASAFLRNAKTYFIRLQAAWDRADVNDIREFTTPEVFGELRLQLQERGASPNHTDVVSLDAELLRLETVGNDYIASVRFSGMIKEAESAQAEAFTEVWNLSKPISGQGGWLLAGIQQLS
ncbi:MAG TPA: TIM44-like domain-containing protein [Noviherbaspirillum sp.]|nr:TIM44-like domain-containing protein [Noviherbaspirillum sp.]